MENCLMAPRRALLKQKKYQGELTQRPSIAAFPGRFGRGRQCRGDLPLIFLSFPVGLMPLASASGKGVT